MTDSEQPLILVADDDPTALLLAEESLLAQGFRVVCAETGDDALTHFNDYDPDAVLLDVRMPGLSGYDICRQLRDAGHDDVPLILITGANDTAQVEKAYRCGANDFIAKPAHWPSVPYRVKHAIESRYLRQKLALQGKRIEKVFDALPDQLMFVDNKGMVTLHDDADPGSGGATTPKCLEDLLPENAVKLARSSLHQALTTGQTQSFEFTRDRGKKVVEVRIIPESKSETIALLRDVTQRHRNEQRIRRLAYFDPVTSLPNRQLFIRELRRAMRQAKRTNTSAAVLYVDLDRFKRINDTLGHTVGDSLLKAVAERLQSCVRPLDLLATPLDSVALADAEDDVSLRQLARLGGDEFVVLLQELDVRESAGAVAARIRRALAAPFTYDRHQFVVTPSIGIATYPEDGSDVEALLMRADTAMYEAKNSGRNTIRFYEPRMDQSSLDRLELENDLRRAVDSDELMLYYQPKVSLSDRSLIGAEALLRWNHPRRGWISPAQFIPLAEETGLIIPIGEWVVREACRQVRRWIDRGVGNLPLAVNVSAEQVARVDIADLVLEQAKDAGVPSSLIEVEITESALMQDAENVKEALGRLQAAGVAVSMDDFGTGYSSLSYLRQFSLDKLKIDRNFVQNLHRDGDSATICSAIVAMARKLGLTVIAEGIEMEEQRDYLANCGCDQGQGFLFGKPVPAAEFEALVQAQQPRQAQAGLTVLPAAGHQVAELGSAVNDEDSPGAAAKTGSA